jgi:hypothetical protein
MAKLRSDAPPSSGGGGGSEQSIELLRKRFEALNEKRIAAETNRKTAEEALEKLRKKARDEYQTDDLAQLQQKLKDMIANNEKLRAGYQKHLDGVETQLAAVEQNYRDASHTASPGDVRK